MNKLLIALLLFGIITKPSLAVLKCKEIHKDKYHCNYDNNKQYKKICYYDSSDNLIFCENN